MKINYVKIYINSLGTRKNCHNNGKNPFLFQIIRKAIKWTIIILSTSYKILSNTLLSRRTSHVNNIIGECPCMFRRNISTSNHIFSIRQILEKMWEYNNKVCQLFVEFEKAYDSIKRESLYKIPKLFF